MNSLQSSLYTAAIALCAFSAGLLRERRSRTTRLPVWFMTFLTIETFSFVFELLMVHPDVPLKALWLGLRMSTALLVAPCLWLAVRESVTGNRPRLSGLHRGHYAAIFTGMVLLLPLFETAHLGLDYPDPHRVVSRLHSRVIHGTMLLCIAIFAVQVPYYLWQCRRLVLNAANPIKWLQIPLAVVATTWALGLLRTVHCATHAPKELSLLFALTDVGVAVGAMYAIIRRTSIQEESVQPAGVQEPVEPPKNAPSDSTAILAAPASSPRGEETEPVGAIVPPVLPLGQPKPVALPITALEQTASLKAKYARSCLDGATRDRIKRKLEKVLVAEEICCDSLLNLRSLSRQINEKAHYVSQVINQDLKATFYELVNRYRIERAKKMLVASPDQTVLEIALAVGFNAKSTFNTAFRQNTGTTPSEFRTKGIR